MVSKPAARVIRIIQELVRNAISKVTVQNFEIRNSGGENCGLQVPLGDSDAALRTSHFK